jgi:hypothetical protein
MRSTQACAGTKSAEDAVNAIQEKTVALMKRRVTCPAEPGGRRRPRAAGLPPATRRSVFLPAAIVLSAHPGPMLYSMQVASPRAGRTRQRE